MNAIVYYPNGKRTEIEDVKSIENFRSGYDPIITYVAKDNNGVGRYVTHLLPGAEKIVINV